MLGLSDHIIVFISTVSMVTQMPVSPENAYFNLKINTLISICHIFSNDISLELSLFAIDNGVSSMVINGHLFIAPIEKLSLKLFLAITAEQNKTFTHYVLLIAVEIKDFKSL